MCFTAWAESAAVAPNNFIPMSGVVINHVTELLNHRPDQKSVKSRVFAAVTVNSDSPIYLHFVHRRYVFFENFAIPSIGQNDWTNDLVDESNLRLVIPADKSKSVSTQSFLIQKVHGESLQAIADPDVSFKIDRYLDLEKDDWRVVPFTSACYGPLAAREEPYLLNFDISITGCSYDRLIAVEAEGWDTYSYRIEGPSVISRGLKPLDLTTAPGRVSSAYEEPFVRGISELSLPMESYDVVTFEDKKQNMSINYYQLFRANIKREWANKSIRINEEEYRVDAWHAGTNDFVIQMAMAHDQA